MQPSDSSGNPCRRSSTTYRITVQIADVLETGKFLGEDLTIKSALHPLLEPGCDHVRPRATSQSWFDKLEFVVVADHVHDRNVQTRRHRPARLPIGSSRWISDVRCSRTHPYLLWQDKCMEPLVREQSLTSRYLGLLVEKMGLRRVLESITDEEYSSKRCSTPTHWRERGHAQWRSSKNEKAARIYPEGDQDRLEARSFGTRDRAHQPVSGDVVSLPTCSARRSTSRDRARACTGRRRRLEPARTAPYRQDHPFHLLSEHMRTRTHTQWWDCRSTSKEYEPEPIVRLNPEDAAELGIAEGDAVKLYNDQRLCAS